MSLGRRDSRAEGGVGESVSVSEPMRRVVDALLEGAPAAPADREALTEAERAELAALVRTANLTRIALQAESPAVAAEQASLDRAQSDLQKRASTGTLPAPPVFLNESPKSSGGLRGWLAGLLGGSAKGGERRNE